MHHREALTAVERAPLDRLLARLLLREPDPELLDALGQPWAEPFGGADVELEAAREEFARLFLLPGGAPPFASAWLEGERERLGAQLTQFVQAMFAALGREPVKQEPWGNLPLDHLGLLLELAADAATSAEAGTQELGEEILAHAVRPWVGAFADALERRARLPLYQAAARLVRQLHAEPA